MKTKEEILNGILEDLHIPEIENALNSTQFNTLVSIHDAILFYQVLPSLIIKQTENESSWRYYHLAFFVYHQEAVKRAYFSFYFAMMGQRSTSESFQRIFLEYIVKGSFWNCISRKRYRNKKTPNANRIKKIRSAMQEMIDKEPGTFSSCQSCSFSAIDTVLDYLDRDSSQKDTWEKVIPKMNDMLNVLHDWNKIQPIKDPQEIYEIYKRHSFEIHSHPDSLIDAIRMERYKRERPHDFHINPMQYSLDPLMKILDFGIVLTLNTFYSEIYRDNDMFRPLPALRDDITQFNLPYSQKKDQNNIVAKS